MSEQELNNRIALRIQYYMDRQNKTQADLADFMGVTQATISNWCNGVKMPRMNKIDRICQFFGIKRSDLMDEPVGDESISDIASYPTIPLLGTVAAGEPIFMSDHEIDRIPLYPNYGEGIFALRISGDSMSPRIQDGDTVIVRQQSDVDNGEIAIVAVDGEEATCKRVMRSPDGITLIADNPTVYPPHFYGPQDDPVTILGKVIEVRARI